MPTPIIHLIWELCPLAISIRMAFWSARRACRVESILASWVFIRFSRKSILVCHSFPSSHYNTKGLLRQINSAIAKEVGAPPYWPLGLQVFVFGYALANHDLPVNNPPGMCKSFCRGGSRPPFKEIKNRVLCAGAFSPRHVVNLQAAAGPDELSLLTSDVSIFLNF